MNILNKDVPDEVWDEMDEYFSNERDSDSDEIVLLPSIVKHFGLPRSLKEQYGELMHKCFCQMYDLRCEGSTVGKHIDGTSKHDLIEQLPNKTIQQFKDFLATIGCSIPDSRYELIDEVLQDCLDIIANEPDVISFTDDEISFIKELSFEL